MDSLEPRARLFARRDGRLRSSLAALTAAVLATSMLASTAAAQPAPGAPLPPPLSPPLQAPAPWSAPPPPGCADLPWVWGFPLPQNGPVWYLAPDAPTLSGKPPPKPGEPPKRPLTKRESLKRGLILAGAIGLGAASVGSAFAYTSAVSKYGFGSGWETMLIPAVGPFIAAAGAAEGVHDPSSAGQAPLLVALGGVETAFAALFFTGLGLSSGKPPPKDAPAPEAPSPMPLPVVLAPAVSSSGGGLSVGGVF